ncbi:unnamed protein product [Arabis nemorensis]|uniref:Uncharacterized protein n=1 Tax=Arabis nemorensis TaxID=586526 RepID=A0A565AUP3_9BRAS|nr:unnamed protein product [Arabis nemorensis]
MTEVILVEVILWNPEDVEFSGLIDQIVDRLVHGWLVYDDLEALFHGEVEEGEEEGEDGDDEEREAGEESEEEGDESEEEGDESEEEEFESEPDDLTKYPTYIPGRKIFKAKLDV